MSNKIAGNDTIAAIATPVGEGGISIIRVSGRGTIDVIASLFKSSSRLSVSEMKPRTFYHGHIVDSDDAGNADEVLCVFMRSPASYTGEDMAEIHCHGGYLVPKKILGHVIDAGARPANAGEFSFRAFLNGKMDLVQAEAVIDIVHADSEEGLRQAELQLEGMLSGLINEYKETVLDILAEVEAQVDFPEEDIDPVIKEDIKSRSSNLIEVIDLLLESYEQGRVLKHGVSTVIIGKPNVGKSSLLNRLLLKDRAIVSPHPGTTRDFIEEILSVGGIALKLSDTAGIRVTADEIERVGVDIARDKAGKSELIIAVMDGSSGLDDDDRTVLELISGKTAIVAINKSDLSENLFPDALKDYIDPRYTVRTSAKTGVGIDELNNAILSLLLQNENPRESGEIVLTELRHKSALEKARASLKAFLNILDLGESPEFLALELRIALDALGEITGETTTEDILGRIFSKFCVGK